MDNMFYGKINFLYGKGEVGETIYYKDKKDYDKEILDSLEVGRPIDPSKITKEEYMKSEELERW